MLGGLVTRERDRKNKQDERKPKRPKLKKETVKDLEAKDKDEGVKGGAGFRSCGCQF